MSDSDPAPRFAAGLATGNQDAIKARSLARNQRH